MTFSEELKSAKDNQENINDLTKKAMAELVSLRASQNKAILTLSEVDMSEMFNIGKQNVANLPIANGQHSFAQFYLDYNNRRKESDREEEKELLAAVNALYNPNAGNNGESEKSAIGQVADILSDGVKDALTSAVGDLKDLFSIDPSSNNSSGAPYGKVLSEGNSSSGFSLDNIQNRTLGEKGNTLVSGGGIGAELDFSYFHDGRYSHPPFAVAVKDNMSGKYNTGVATHPNVRWVYSGNDANSNMLITTTNGSGIGLAAWTPINSSIPENTRTVSGVSGQVDKAKEFFNNFTGKNVKYSYGFSFSMRFKLKGEHIPGTVARSFFYSEDDAKKFNIGDDSNYPTNANAGVNWIEHSEMWNLNEDTGYFNKEKKSNDVSTIFKANINKKLFNSYLDKDDGFKEADYYKANGLALTQVPDSGLWKNGYEIYKPGSPTNKQIKVGSEVEEIKSNQKTMMNDMLSKPSVNYKHNDAKADVIGGSYSYTTPNQKANVNYLISHEASDFMNNMFTCWIETDGEDGGGNLYNFNDNIENNITSISSDEVSNNDNVKGALQFTFGVNKIDIPLPMQGNKQMSFCGIPYAIAGGSAPNVKRRASIEVASDQMGLIYGTIYNWISMYRIHNIATLSPKSLFEVDKNLQVSTTDSLAKLRKLNLCILAWTDNRIFDGIAKKGHSPNIKKFDNFSELIDSGYVTANGPVIPMNLIVFKNVRFDSISEIAYKNSSQSPLSHKIDFSYQEAYIREWAISKEITD